LVKRWVTKYHHHRIDDDDDDARREDDGTVRELRKVRRGRCTKDKKHRSDGRSGSK